MEVGEVVEIMEITESMNEWKNRMLLRKRREKRCAQATAFHEHTLMVRAALRAVAREGAANIGIVADCREFVAQDHRVNQRAIRTLTRKRQTRMGSVTDKREVLASKRCERGEVTRRPEMRLREISRVESFGDFTRPIGNALANEARQRLGRGIRKRPTQRIKLHEPYDARRAFRKESDCKATFRIMKFAEVRAKPSSQRWRFGDRHNFHDSDWRKQRMRKQRGANL